MEKLERAELSADERDGFLLVSAGYQEDVGSVPEVISLCPSQSFAIEPIEVWKLFAEKRISDAQEVWLQNTFMLFAKVKRTRLGILLEWESIFCSLYLREHWNGMGSLDIGGIRGLPAFHREMEVKD